ncbi:MAG: HEAT repeat domain-containing protein [Nitrospirae bacterium]|nr:HEAT repeat domain-containing protein [Nitrospirota bacterium]
MNKYPPECPFCGLTVERPETTKTEFGEVLSGRCRCGSVYVCDPTGHNAGEAYMEALALAKGDWNLDSMEYEMIDMAYDLKTHQRIYSKGQSTLSGKLVFVKLELPGAEGSIRAQDAEAAASVAPAIREGGRMKIKDRVRELLESKSYGDIVSLALQDKGVIRWLISSAYDKEDVISWRAIEALGLIARGFSAQNRLDVIRDTIRRLLWSMGEESGGIGWSAAEMLGEIITNNPDAFNDIIPIVWSFRDEEMFRPGIVWAMGRIATVRPDLILFISGDLRSLIADRNPAVRGYAAWVIGIIGDSKAIEELKELLNDGSRIAFYRNGELDAKTVGEIVKEVLNKVINKLR